jgi:plasmid stabilization system protein ParE
MGYRIVVSDHAHNDLDGIIDYIAINLGNPKAADNLLMEIEKQYGLLAESPALYPVSREPLLAIRGYRWFPAKNYLGIYSINDDKSEVYVARIVYGGSNLSHIL